MKLIRTAKIKLDIVTSEVLPTIQAYTKAFNFVCQEGFKNKDYNSISLHKKTYSAVREYLPSQLSISSRMKATEALAGVLKKKKKYYSCPQSKLCSIRYDVNSYSLSLSKSIASLSTINGRKKYKMNISENYKELFASWKYTSADLCIIKNKVYLHIVFQKDIVDVQPNGKFIGIDRGINNIAVVSNNKFYGGNKVKQIVKKYQRLRGKLQSAGTKSAKRHLRQLRQKERRFRADINHQISKEIVASLNPGDTIVLEDLKGIRKRSNKMRKKQRAAVNGWSFYQLEQFITYKALAKGINVIHIDARYTSQRCSKCGQTERSNRKTQSDFSCKKCGFKLNADLNASRNICNKHIEAIGFNMRVEVNQPIVTTERLVTNHQHKADGN